MAQFKVGDKVTGEGIDGVGIIKTANELDNEYEVEYLTETADWFSKEEMSLLETKTADDMLEELGWKFNHDLSTRKEHRYTNEEILGSHLSFHTVHKEYFCDVVVNIKLHNAISKKVQELGWL